MHPMKNVMSQELCVVVIFIHKPDPSPYELISFAQCFRILGTHPIRIVAPRNLPLHKYKDVVPHFETVYIPPKWLSALAYYNKLKTSRFFYNLFNEYEYLLTYELDAFVFKDELAYWCTKGYDYIGAPWFEGFSNPKDDAPITGVGNSGFSLRKIKPVQKILKSMYARNPLDTDTGVRALLKVYGRIPLRWLTSKLSGENHHVVKDFWAGEDRFFSLAVPQVYNWFNVAPVEDAIKFSFELKPERLFVLNHQQLPMGCHAWWKYNLDFWKPFIEKFGYTL